MSNDALARAEEVYSSVGLMVLAVQELITAARSSSAKDWPDRLTELYETYYFHACEYSQATRRPNPLDAVVEMVGTPDASAVVRAIRCVLAVEEQMWNATGGKRPPRYTPGIRLKATDLAPLRKHAGRVQAVLQMAYGLSTAQVENEMDGELAKVRVRLRSQQGRSAIENRWDGKPHWDQASLTLTYGAFSKTYSCRAANPMMILRAFEEDKWVQSIKNPLPKADIKNAVESLNDGLKRAGIKFGRAAKGMKVTWRRVPN